MSDVASVLVVDAGNTSIKFTAFQGDELLWARRESGFPCDIGFIPQHIYIASVRDHTFTESLCANLQSEFPDSRVLVLISEAVACGVKNAYIEPERLGVDRWLGVVAAHHIVSEDVVVVDAGTAIKVDVVSKEGFHLGGYIVPGLAMMENSLLTKTARIHYAASEVLVGKGLPDSTARAVTEGCNEMALGFLERIYRCYKRHRWVVTGGDAQALLERLGVSLELKPHLVALGAKLVGDEQIRGEK